MSARYFRFTVSFDSGLTREVQIIEANERAAKKRLAQITTPTIKKIISTTEITRADYIDYCQKDLDEISGLASKLFYR